MQAGLEQVPTANPNMMTIVYHGLFISLPFAINALLQNGQFEMLDGNLVNLLLPLTETLLLI